MLRYLAVLLVVVLGLTGCAGGSSARPAASFTNASASGLSALPQTGKASWYGGQFQGRPTASGEKFDRRAMTAAHATVPFGTFVKVTNLENNRSVIVRINDRFPGTKNRVIDLSEGAFSRIANPDQGVISVQVELVRAPQ